MPVILAGPQFNWSWGFESVLKNPLFLRDSRRLLEIPEPVFDAAVDAVEAAEGFAGPSRLEALVGAAIGDQSQRQALTNFLVNFAAFRLEAGDVDDFAPDVEGRTRSALSAKLDAGELDALCARLRKIVAPKRALLRQAKADKLASRTGAGFQELSITCDLRPIFDDGRELIEGLMPITTLRLVVERAGIPHVVEATLSESELLAICSEAERAKRKIERLRAQTKELGLESPETPPRPIQEER